MISAIIALFPFDKRIKNKRKQLQKKKKSTYDEFRKSMNIFLVCLLIRSKIDKEIFGKFFAPVFGYGIRFVNGYCRLS